ncbi:cytochrome bd-I ubiquinol oxidase subunit 1 apoprotein [Longilinea arvoryzae]|uniref:Cytochrome bd-I ubiquinol oxidase subunit 1 apoprotein n=1 Tax=Longilinea arvoryzae TaxID=360412 RepID=A0A0S7BMI0_9CHLR|nr:cytochrome ubiquinol oxidase subunit I [Longilinea arvoryzae]GAP15211.1 cytochrome bd-I ubiquinol oxidase subunit 1 apoprotein [Longilinea arvoryzae]
MNVLTLSQIQFAVTTIYHFFFVPLTIGLSVLVALMETQYARTNNEDYKRMAKFWGKLFLINFAMGVVTGIVQEFQFGMNWSEYSRFVGDIFGAPLAIEALLAFFLESTFLGFWIFSWERVSKKLHLTAIWLVAFGTVISALWILIANSFMQQPVGYSIQNGRAVMSDFGALLQNPNVWVQFPHVIFSGFTTAAFFVMSISAYHLLRKKDGMFRRSFQTAAVFGSVAVLLVILVGHSQAQHMVQTQPMKMAAAEALWNSEDPAALSLFTIVDQANKSNIVDIRIPRLLSLLSYNRLNGRVMGINELQADYEQTYGAGNYTPIIFINYWSFRVMVGLGFLMFAVAAYALFNVLKNRPAEKFKFLNLFPFFIALPYLSNTTGWILTEIGRQPWVVYGLLKTEDAFSPNLSTGMVLASLIGFTLVYGLLLIADVYLLAKYAKAGPEPLADEGKPIAIEEAYQE